MPNPTSSQIAREALPAATEAVAMLWDLDTPIGEKTAEQVASAALNASGLPAEVERLNGAIDEYGEGMDELSRRLVGAEALAARYREVLEEARWLLTHAQHGTAGVSGWWARRDAFLSSITEEEDPCTDCGGGGCMHCDGRGSFPREALATQEGQDG